MRRILFALVWSAILATPVLAGEVVLSRETRLLERPAAEAAVKATLPAGMRLEVLTEQGDWLAVSSGSLSGWIRRADVDGAAAPPAGDEDADEIIRSIREIAAESDSAGAPPPPSPSGSPPPPPVSGTPPAPTGETAPTGGGLTPPPPPSGSGTGSSLPPPPPARPPSQRGKNTYGPTSPWGGFYQSRTWYRLIGTFGVDEEKGGALDFAFSIGRPVKLGFKIGGSTSEASQPPGFDILRSAVEEEYFVGIDIFETVEDPITSADMEMYLDVFLSHPNPARPVGFYLGGFFTFRQFFGLDDAYGGAFDDLTLQRYGGEVGMFHATAGTPRLIGRLAARLMNDTYAAGDATASETVTGVLVGLELQAGSFVPGLFLTTHGDDKEISLSLGLVR